MPLDPDIKKLLQMMESLKRPAFSDMNIKDIRKMMDNSPIPKKRENVKSVRDLKFEHHGNTIGVRLYTPDTDRNGLIIFLHGGGFVFGNLESHDDICRLAANRSKTRIMSVDYRLAPENKFPAALDDAVEAVLWAQKNADTLGIDPKKIGVAGDSAGGNLSASLCLFMRDKKMKMPALQVLIYPSVGRDSASESMREFSSGYFLTEEDMNYFGGAYLNSPSDLLNPYFSPLIHSDLSGLPEAIIVTAEYDPLRDQGEAYLSRLQRYGVRCTGIRAKGMIHGFASFFPVVSAAENILSMVWFQAGDILHSDSS